MNIAKNQSAVRTLVESGYGFDRNDANRLVSNLEKGLADMYETFFSRQDSDDTVRILSEAFSDLEIETEGTECDCTGDHHECPHGAVTYVRFGGHEFGRR